MTQVQTAVFLFAVLGVFLIGVQLVTAPAAQAEADNRRIAAGDGSFLEDSRPEAAAGRTPAAYRRSGVFLLAASLVLFAFLNPWFAIA